MKKTLLVLAILATLPACSSIQALSQPGPADIDGIGVGTSREEVMSRIGTPKMTDLTASGDKQDVFEFQSGFNQATKLRIFPYIAADLFTLFLSELVFWPLELSLLDKAECSGVATYGNDLRVETWTVSAKKSGTLQGC